MLTLNRGTVGGLVLAALLTTPTLAHAQGTVLVSGNRATYDQPTQKLTLDATASLSGFANKANMGYSAVFKIKAKKPDDTVVTFVDAMKSGTIDANGNSTVSIAEQDVTVKFVDNFRVGQPGGWDATKAAFNAQAFDISVKITFTDGTTADGTGTVSMGL